MTSKPLLSPGLHDMALSDLDNHFVSSFGQSQTRGALVNNLKRYIEALRQFGISFELWIDGSFATDKENPNDVDIVVFGSKTDIDNLPTTMKDALSAVFDRVNIRQTLGCDVLFTIAEDQTMRSYWRGWYGYDRNEQPKGIARIRIAP